MSDELQHTFEEKVLPDGSVVCDMKNAAGVLKRRRTINADGSLTERISYNNDGKVIGRTIYFKDGNRKPLKTTAYDGAGEIIFTQDRGKPPVFYGKYKAGVPKWMWGNT
jgi:hypothetical protein